MNNLGYKKIAFFFLFPLFLICLMAYYDRPQVSNASTTSFAAKLIEYTNDERQLKLTEDACLDAMAVARAKYLVRNHIWAHFSPDGTTPWMFIDDCGRYWRAGENLAKNFDDPQEAHRALMDSPEHKKNIVNPDFHQIGVGCYKDLCVEFFK